MNKKSILLLSLLCATAGGVDAGTLPDGKYYIQNVVTGTYLSVGANYATRCVLRPHGVDFTVTSQGGDVYTLQTRINGSTKGLRNTDAYMDGSDSSWTLELQDDGTYAIHNGSKYFGYDKTYSSPWVPRLNWTDASDEATHWRFLSPDDLQATLATATKEAPVDATFLIVSPDFWTYDRRIMTDHCWGPDLTATGGNESSSSYLENPMNGEQFNKTFDVTQTLKGLPDGVYSLTAQAYYRYGTNTAALAAREAGEEQLLAVLYAGSKQKKIKSVYDEAKTSKDEGWNYNKGIYYVPNTQAQAAYCFTQGAYENTINNIVVSGGELKIGIRKTEKVDEDWCCFDNFTLLYYGPADGTESEDEEERLMAIEQLVNSWKPMESIAAQAVDHSAFDALLAQAMKDVLDADGPEERNEIDAKVRKGLYDLLATFDTNTATGQFDVTALLANPSLDSGSTGWELGTAHSMGFLSDYGLAEKWDCYDGFDVHQTLKQMPAGTYTAKVQGFYRTAMYSRDAVDYEFGNAVNCATFYLQDVHQPVRLAQQGGRFTPAPEGRKSAGSFGRTIPDYPDAVAAAFDWGQYWNTLTVDLPAQADLTLGLDITGGERENWLTYDNFRLYYGNAVARLTLDAEQPYTLADDTKADVTLKRKFTAGKWHSLCVPFDMDGSQFSAIRSVLGMQDGAAVVRDEQSIKSGRTYLVQVASDIEQLTATDVLVSAERPDSLLMPWEGGGLRGSYSDGFTARAFFDDGTSADLSELEQAPIDYNNVSMTINLENNRVRGFLRDYEYTVYDKTRVASYNVAPVGRRDQPHTVWVPLLAGQTEQTLVVGLQAEGTDAVATLTVAAGENGCEVANLVPGNTYYYKAVDAGGAVTGQGQITTEGSLRMIKASSVSNIRDLGGWINAKGQQVRYGKIYRGGEFNGNSNHQIVDSDKEILRGLNIRAEVDLRSFTHDNPDPYHTASELGSDVAYRASDQWEHSSSALKNASDMEKWAGDLDFTMDHVLAGDAVYFHCVWGADRTGIMGFLIDGLMGLTPDQIFKDYELTTFSWAGERTKPGMENKLAYIMTMPGATLQQQFEYYVTELLGLDADKVARFQEAMLTEETPAVQQAAAKEYEALKQSCFKIYALAGEDAAPLDFSESDALLQSDALAAVNRLQELFEQQVEALGQPIDITSLFASIDFENESTEGWEPAGRGKLKFAGEGVPLAEFYQATDTMYQHLGHMPRGIYTAKMQGFQREGSRSAAYTNYIKGQSEAFGHLVVGGTAHPLNSIYADAMPEQQIAGSSEYYAARAVWTPFTLSETDHYFRQRGAYWNVATTRLVDGGDLMIAITSKNNASGYWMTVSPIHIYYGKELQTVTLTEDEPCPQLSEAVRARVITRPLAAGQWNTVCLPVDLDEKGMEAAGITEANKLTGVGITDGKAVAKVAAVKRMHAGRPYLVKVAQAGPLEIDETIVSPIAAMTVVVADGSAFAGTYESAPVQDVYCFDYDRFYYTGQTVNSGAYQAYVSMPAGTDVSVILLPDSDTTGITEAETSGEDAVVDVYTLSGVLVKKAVKRSQALDGVRSGIYVVGGTKMVK